ncbi:hypothetical protein [Cohaesibacter gelatinilyticus]|uniref:Uncharacterized protein n=1 Tax=Cohaesibacter gelatinilyticus TaxID=372072 RepID=A0A285PFH6_9HYPH|nr:hypothetical protein [Cohaesibacter gelatinilyticus]SNZ20472.1 hypothetical protein SAMN06265368_3576 [Cohaesibacter gelatinilyticus]
MPRELVSVITGLLLLVVVAGTTSAMAVWAMHEQVVLAIWIGILFPPLISSSIFWSFLSKHDFERNDDKILSIVMPFSSICIVTFIFFVLYIKSFILFDDHIFYVVYFLIFFGVLFGATISLLKGFDKLNLYLVILVTAILYLSLVHFMSIVIESSSFTGVFSNFKKTQSFRIRGETEGEATFMLVAFSFLFFSTSLSITLRRIGKELFSRV